MFTLSAKEVIQLRSCNVTWPNGGPGPWRATTAAKFSQLCMSLKQDKVKHFLNNGKVIWLADLEIIKKQVGHLIGPIT